MRIVSWNMNYAFRSNDARGKAWSYLRENLRPDLALVQEASPPSDLPSVYRRVGDETQMYEWGSAVVALRSDLTLRPRTRVPLAECYMKPPAGQALPDSHPGASAVADVLDRDGRRLLTAVSMYGQWEVMPGGGPMYACARVHRILSDLTSVLVGARRMPVVLAGDLNVTTQRAGAPSTEVEADAAAVVFARLRAWHLVDCVAKTHAGRPRLPACTCSDGDACSHVQTYRHNNRADGNPTQLDYAFVSEPLASRRLECQVVHDEGAWQLSDHCPIVLDIDEC